MESLRSPERLEQSWENFEDEQEGEDIAIGEPSKSSFTDSSDEETPREPDINEEDLWSDEEANHTPLPRPGTPLEPSELEIKLQPQRERERNERHRRRAAYVQVRKDESTDRPPRPFSGHQSDAYDTFGYIEQKLNCKERRKNPSVKPMPDIHEKRETNWKAGRSGLKNATASSPTSPKAKMHTNAAVSEIWNDADEVDSFDGEIEGTPAVADGKAGSTSNDVKADEEKARYFDSGYGDDKDAQKESAVAEQSELMTEADDESHRADVPRQDGKQADQFQREGSKGRLVESHPNREDKDLMMSSAMPMERLPERDMAPSPDARRGSARPITQESDDEITRPSSPINQFRTDVKPQNSGYTLEREFDELAMFDPDNPPKYPRSVGQAVDINENGESSETPETPTSADDLEDVTDMSLEDGTYRFNRLTELAESRLMRDPQRALEMKRQMLLYRHGHEEDKLSRIGDEGAKISKKASNAWKSAAVHGYRHQREEALKKAKFYKEMAYREHALNQAQDNDLHRSAQANWCLNQQLAEALQEVEDYETNAEHKQEELCQSQEKLRKAEEDHESTREKLRASEETNSKIRKYLLTVKPYLEMKRRRDAFPPTDAETQTSSPAFPVRDTTSRQKSEKFHSFEQPDRDTDAETEGTIANDDDDGPRLPSIHRGTQTLPVTIADQTQDNVHRGNRSAVPLLRFEVAGDIQDRVVGGMVDFINAARSREIAGENDDSGESIVAATERINTVLSRRLTYPDFVSALRNDGLLFYEDHLAQHLINQISGRSVPLALLQQMYPITTRNTYQDVERLYHEIVQRKDEISLLRTRINTVPPGHNTEDGAITALMTSMRELTAEKEDIKAELKKLKDETIRKLDKDNDQYRRHGELLQLALDDKDSEIGKVTTENIILNDELRTWKGKCEKLQEAVECLRSENSRYNNRSSELKAEQSLLPYGIDENKEESGKMDGDELTNLRKEMEMLRAENHSLQAETDKLEGENQRCNVLLNQATQASMRTEQNTQGLPSTATPRTSAVPQPLLAPNATTVPQTPSPLPSNPSFKPNAIHLLRPSDTASPRTAVLPAFAVHVNESMLRPSWVERERRIQNTARWKSDVARILANIENQEYFEELQREGERAEGKARDNATVAVAA